ncbi:MAG: hypothetical protein H0X11_13560 [Betaproteobacteria bacterium]|nr:hypothetical protein [Betaproteobacteria bacterium]
MKPVNQRKADDCFAACLASLLELPLAIVPSYAKRDAAYQVVRMQEWLRRLGLTYLEINLSQRPRTGSPMLGVLTVEVPACEHLHAVVAEYHDGRIKVVHDPANHSRLGRRVYFGWLIPLTVPKAA